MAVEISISSVARETRVRQRRLFPCETPSFALVFFPTGLRGIKPALESRPPKKNLPSKANVHESKGCLEANRIQQPSGKKIKQVGSCGGGSEGGGGDGERKAESGQLLVEIIGRGWRPSSDTLAFPHPTPYENRTSERLPNSSVEAREAPPLPLRLNDLAGRRSTLRGRTDVRREYTARRTLPVAQRFTELDVALRTVATAHENCPSIPRRNTPSKNTRPTVPPGPAILPYTRLNYIMIAPLETLQPCGRNMPEATRNNPDTVSIIVSPTLLIHKTTIRTYNLMRTLLRVSAVSPSPRYSISPQPPWTETL